MLREVPLRTGSPSGVHSKAYLNSLYPVLNLPMRKVGLRLAQRLNYLMTMYSYLSGPFMLIQLTAPIIYLTTGIPPVISYTAPYFIRLLPFLILNRIVFFIVAQGIKTWRAEQHNVALFPLWIKALTSAINNVLFGRKLGFVVTPKDGATQRRDFANLRTVWPQLAYIAATVLAIAWGFVLVIHGDNRRFGILVNCFWAMYNIALLSAAPYAALWRPRERQPAPQTPQVARTHGETIRALRGVPSVR